MFKKLYFAWTVFGIVMLPWWFSMILPDIIYQNKFNIMEWFGLILIFLTGWCAQTIYEVKRYERIYDNTIKK